MAIAIDASSPVRWSGTPGTNVDITSASFTPPAGALLVVCVGADSTASDITISVSDSQTLTWTQRVERDHGDASAEDGHASIWTALVATSTAMTVSVRRTTTGGGSNTVSAVCYVVTGQHSAPIGATGEGSSTANASTPTAYTSTANNSRGFGSLFIGADGGGAATSADTEDSAHFTGSLCAMSLHKAADTATSGTAVTIDWDAAAAGAIQLNWVALEILAATGGGGGATIWNLMTTGHGK